MHHLAAAVRPITLARSPRLSEHAGAEILIASETLQYTGSFKFRAAYNVVSKTPKDHFYTASSGNFGQALAYSCSLLGKRCSVVMPATSSMTKVEAVRAYGGEVDLIDISKISRAERIEELAKQYPDAYFASPFDDDLVIEGNATIADELFASGEEFDVVVCPIGGGGLASGLVNGLRGHESHVEVVGAEPLLANDAARSLREGKLIANETEPQTIADGTRTVSLGIRNWAILQHGLSGIIEVEECHIREGVRLLYSLANLKCEPTGALSLGAVLREPKRFEGRKVCCFVSGGNVDASLYAELITAE